MSLQSDSVALYCQIVYFLIGQANNVLFAETVPANSIFFQKCVVVKSEGFHLYVWGL